MCCQSAVHLSADEVTQLMHRQTRQLQQLNTQNEQLAVSVNECSKNFDERPQYGGGMEGIFC